MATSIKYKHGRTQALPTSEQIEKFKACIYVDAAVRAWLLANRDSVDFRDWPLQAMFRDAPPVDLLGVPDIVWLHGIRALTAEVRAFEKGAGSKPSASPAKTRVWDRLQPGASSGPGWIESDDFGRVAARSPNAFGLEHARLHCASIVDLGGAWEIRYSIALGAAASKPVDLSAPPPSPFRRTLP